MPVSKSMHRPNKHTFSSCSSSGLESSSLSHDDDSIQQPLDRRDANEQYPVGTAVKKWFKNGHGWCKGVIVSVTGSSSSDKSYKVRYDGDESTGEMIHTYSVGEMPKLVKTAVVEPGTRLEVFWPHEKSWFPATVEQERMQKRENYLVSYDGKTEREWIDLHRHRIRVLQQPLCNRKLGAKPHPHEVVVRRPSSLSNHSSPRRGTSFERQSSVNSQTSFSSCPHKPPAESATQVAASSEAEAETPNQSTFATGILKNDSHVEGWGDEDDGKVVAEKPAAVAHESSVSYGISPASSTSNRSVVEALDHGMASPPMLHVQTDSAFDAQKPAGRVVSTSSQPAGMAFVTNDDSPTVDSQPDGAKSLEMDANPTEPVEKTKENATPNDDVSSEEGIILDPVNDPATMSAVYSLIGIGSKISIYIEEDGAFYNATVTDRKLRGKPFYVEYDDGDEGWIDLRQHRIRLFPQSAASYSGDRVVGGKMLRRVTGKDHETSKHGDTDIDTAIVSVAAPSAPEKSDTHAKPRNRVARKSMATKLRSGASARKIEGEASDRDDDDDDDADYKPANQHASLAADSDNCGSGAGAKKKDRKSSRNTPSDTKADDLSKICVGSRVAVWWDDDEQYYDGTVKRQRSHRKPFFIEYDDDGKGEWIDFAEHSFKILPNMPAERKRRGRPSSREDPRKVRIGSRVAVWWASVSRFLEGTVTKKRKHDHPYFIEYDEGEAGHWIDFAKHTFRLLDSNDDLEPKSGSLMTTDKKNLSNGTGACHAEVEHPKKRKKLPEHRQKESGDALDDLEITVGSRVAVYWEGDSKYYEGVVTKERKTGKKRHYLVYDDGEAAHWIDFREHWVRVLPDRTPKKQKTAKTEGISTPPKARSRVHERVGDGYATNLSSRARAAERARLLAKIGPGVVVEIWWAGDDRYYKGTVIRAGKEKNRFYVRYDDGEEEWVNFSRQAFRIPTADTYLVEENSSDVEASEDDEPLADARIDVESSDEDVDETHKYNDFVYGVVDDVRVGSKLSVWWPGEKKYFEGIVAQIDNSRKPYFIKYKDGDEEWTDLRRRYFRIL